MRSPSSSNGLLVQNIVGARASPQRPRSGRWPSRLSCTCCFPLLLLIIPPAQRALTNGRCRHARGRRGRDRRARISPRCTRFVIQSAAGPSRAAVCGRASLKRRHRPVRAGTGPQGRGRGRGLAPGPPRRPVAGDDLVAGLGVDARPPVSWSTSRLGPAIACLLAALATEPDIPPPLLAHDLDAKPIRNLGQSSYKPVPEPTGADRRDRLREACCRSRQPGRPGVSSSRSPSGGCPLTIMFRAAVRVGVREGRSCTRGAPPRASAACDFPPSGRGAPV